jgi:putative addiction module killer protein
MIEVRQTELFASWFEDLRDRRAKVRIQMRIDRMEIGNFGDCASVGDGVLELRIHYGPGYRVYFAQRDEMLVVLLAGGDKSTQDSDIQTAKKVAKQLED